MKINKIAIYICAGIIAVLLSAYFSLVDNCTVVGNLSPECARSSLFVSVSTFTSIFPWILLAVYVPVTAVLFYWSGMRRKRNKPVPPIVVEEKMLANN